jgi:hypothetical protein
LHYSDLPIVLAWSGPIPPPITGPRITRVEQPKGLERFGPAFEFACGQTVDDELIVMNDDAIMHPDTVDLLLEDVEKLRANSYKVGWVACRSTYIRPHQRALGPEEQVLKAPTISPVCAYVDREALAVTSWPPIDWYSDDLMCWEMAHHGYEHFVSRSFVYHIGERSTRERGETRQDLHDVGLAWIREHRPEFYAHMTKACDGGTERVPVGVEDGVGTGDGVQLLARLKGMRDELRHNEPMVHTG